MVVYDDDQSATYSQSSIFNHDSGFEDADVLEKDLPRLQLDGQASRFGHYHPILEDDPASYDLAEVTSDGEEEFSLEQISQAMFSREHLQVIFADPSLLLRFTSFVGTHRPQSIPILVHYLDALKSLRAISYANAICQGLDPVEGCDFTQQAVPDTTSKALEERANAAFEILAQEELPAYITHQYQQVVTVSIRARIAGTLAPHLRDASEGLAEVFCLSDPTRKDNPILFASEEFFTMTQYGVKYSIGRNCRFLQGPMTSPLSVKRLRDAIGSGNFVQEVFLNYRRDGSPFMNLLMVAPLTDSRGILRYHLAAQVDVSGLVKDCAELPSLRRMLDLRIRGETVPNPQKPSPEKNDELRELSEMLNQDEITTIRRYGGRMHRDTFLDDTAGEKSMMNNPTPNITSLPQVNGTFNAKLNSLYQHFLLIRPYPSLRIIFASPSQRMPGILQSPFMDRIGGSTRVREELVSILAQGTGVTAKVRWLTKKGPPEGRNRWIHCTPLLGHNSQVGVWMVVLIDDEKEGRR